MSFGDSSLAPPGWNPLTPQPVCFIFLDLVLAALRTPVCRIFTDLLRFQSGTFVDADLLRSNLLETQTCPLRPCCSLRGWKPFLRSCGGDLKAPPGSCQPRTVPQITSRPASERRRIVGVPPRSDLFHSVTWMRVFPAGVSCGSPMAQRVREILLDQRNFALKSSANEVQFSFNWIF